jgi:hypothetical protein
VKSRGIPPFAKNAEDGAPDPLCRARNTRLLFALSLPVQQLPPLEAPPSPLSSRPKRSAVGEICGSAALPWICFSTERSGVAGPASVMSARASAEKYSPSQQNCHPTGGVMGLYTQGDEKLGSVRQPHSMEAPPSPLSSRPKRSAVERSAVPRSFPGNVFRQSVPGFPTSRC